MQNVGLQKLRNCPFCGGKAILVRDAKREIYGSDRYMTGVAIGCDTCTVNMFYGSEKRAIEAWNRRADEQIHGMEKASRKRISICQ